MNGGDGGEGKRNSPTSKNKKQLASLRMKTLEAIGVIHTREYNFYLYNPNDPKSAILKKKASDAQLQVLAKGRKMIARRASYNK